MSFNPYQSGDINDINSAGFKSTGPSIATTRMQSSNYPPLQPTNQIPFHNVSQPHNSSTPTLQPKYPADVGVRQSLTPQLQPKHYQHSVLDNQMSALSVTPLANQIPTSQPMTFQPPPTSQPMTFQPPTSQPMTFQRPPTSQPMTFQPPPASQPMTFQPPPTSQPMTFQPPPTSQPMTFQPPPASQPMTFQPPTSQPMPFQPPPASQPMTFQPPASQPMTFQPPPVSQPMAFQPPSTSQPMTFQPIDSQSVSFQQLPSQPTIFQNLPISQPMTFPSSQPTFQHPSSQPMTFQPPPSTQPTGFQPPPSQPTGFQPPPSTQAMPFPQSTFQSVPTPQQFGTNQLPQNQPMGTAAPFGQFGAPPITSQPKVTSDSIPSVVEILETEKERWVSNEYLTGSRTLPPGSLITCPIRDTGNCSPRFIRSSLYTLPTSPDMIQESKLIPGIIVQPLASDPDNPKLPLVDHGPSGPIRCKRCKAYMNPFNAFTGGGANYDCVFCGITNEVPSSYVQYCDASGRRMDAGERHELSLGSFEMSVTKDYKRNQRDGLPPAIVLVLDISQRSYNNGVEGFLSSHLAGLLGALPKDEATGESPMEVGLIAYDTQAYFFNLSVATPLVYVLTDTSEPFLPEPAGSLVPVAQAINSIKSILERFPVLFPQRKSGACLGIGAKAGLSMLSEMRRVGKLLVFQSDIPEVYGPGQLKRRTDNFFKPQNSFYEKLSAECQKAGVSVDLFLLPSAYADVFTLGQLCHFTGGHIHYHYNFSASKPACYSRLLTELQQSLSAEKGFDAVMRIRTSAGISTDQFQGAIRLNGTEVQLPGVDAAKSLAVVLKYDEKLKENSLVYIQVALLYTDFRGERRLRLHNLALCTSSHFEDVYLSADQDAMVQLLCRLNLRAFIEEPLAGVAERIRQQVAHILATYRRHCNPGSNRGQLILPATMKLLPCYSNCILKLSVSPLHNSQPNSPDIRAAQFYRLQWLPTRDFLLQLYPRIFPVEPDCHSLSQPIRSSLERIQEDRVYLSTDGQQMVLWLCSSLSMQLVAELFGVSSVHQVDPSLSTLPKLDNDTSRSLHQSIQSLRSWAGRPLSLVLSKQGDPSESIFRSFLVEDGVSGRATYVDATCMLHREIKKLLN